MTDERGSGTVLVVAAIGLVVVLSLAGIQLGAAAGAAHRARSAADLSALGGAAALQQGAGDPCAGALELAARNGARLVACAVGPAESVLVRVSADVRGAWPGVPRSASASARAGPADVVLPPSLHGRAADHSAGSGARTWNARHGIS